MRDLRRSPQNTNTAPESIPLVPISSTASRLGAIFSAPAAFLGRSTTPSGGRQVGGGSDGVFANISAKPTVEVEEQLPVSSTPHIILPQPGGH